MTERKGISPLIAAVLLIAFTMAVAGLFSSWAPELLQGIQSDTSEDTESLLEASRAGLSVDSAVFDSDSGNTSVVFRNTGQTELSNFTVTARLEDGSFVQKSVSKTVKPAGIVNLELNTSSSPDLVRVDSEELELSAEMENSGDLVDDKSSGTLGPTASFSINISGKNASVGEEIEFDASGSTEGDSSITSYTWDFNDTNTSTGEIVTHNYSLEGNYTVELEVTDSNGEKSTDTVEIEIETAKPDSAIARWTFDNSDTDSGTAIDVWNDSDGTINGANTGVTGIASYDSGEAYNFTGDDYIGSTGIDLTKVGLPLTFSAWIKPDKVSEKYSFFTNRDGGEITEGLQFQVNTGDIRFRFKGGEPNIFSNENVNADTAYFVTGVADTDEARLYIDGELDKTDSGTPNLNSDLDLLIGAEAYEGLNYFDGVIDDPRVYNEALNDTEVENLYNTGSIDG